MRLSDFLRRIAVLKRRGAKAVAPPPSEITGNRLAELRRLEERLGYPFQNPALLDRALTHKSFVHEATVPGEGRDVREDYEAMEFLGDALLGLVISDFLFRTYPDRSEGELSKLKSFLVSANQLSLLSQQLELGQFVRLSFGEEKTGGRGKKAILADLFESLIAAIYLDSSLRSAREFILEQYGSRFEKIAQETLDLKDYKSALQEQLHLLGFPEPRYRVVDEVGPDHSKQFLVEVRVKDRILARASGTSKKEAQQRAAQIAMEALEENIESTVDSQ